MIENPATAFYTPKKILVEVWRYKNQEDANVLLVFERTNGKQSLIESIRFGKDVSILNLIKNSVSIRDVFKNDDNVERFIEVQDNIKDYSFKIHYKEFFPEY